MRIKNAFFLLSFCSISLLLVRCKQETNHEFPPEASFTYTINSLTVNFNNTSTNDPSTLFWDYGDGTSGTAMNHTYIKDSTYIVTLTAINDAGEDQISQSIVVAEELHLIEIKTDFGDMIMWLYDETPLHKENFLTLADSGFYDSTTFHRIINGFVIQGGDPNSKDNDPTNDGIGGPGYEIDAEINSDLTHVYGAVGAARMPDNVNPLKKSNGSQFYIVESQNGAHQLDDDYTVFGIIIDGMEAAEIIATQPKDGADRPISDIRMDVNVITKTRTELADEYEFEL